MLSFHVTRIKIEKENLLYACKLKLNGQNYYAKPARTMFVFRKYGKHSFRMKLQLSPLKT